MKKKLLRIISLGLCLCSLLMSLAACANNTDEELETTEGEVTTTVLDTGFETDENGFVKDTIDRTLGGSEIHILMDSSSRGDIMPEAFTSGKDVISDAAYTRNLELEMRLDCTFKVTQAPGEWKGMTEFIQVAEKAGDSDVDIICAFSLVPSQLQQRGYLSNLNNLVYPQLEMPWWPESIHEWEQGGALYYVANNSSNRVIRAQEVVFANAEMIRNAGLPALEQIVIDGDWTIETMVTYAMTVTTNIDDPVDDRIYGLVVDDQGRMDQFFYGAGLDMTAINENNEIELTIFSQSSIDKVDTLISQLGRVAAHSNFLIEANNFDIMKQSRTMFMAAYMNCITHLSDGSSYIPLPTPKYDENQEEYYTTPHNSYDVWCIPLTCQSKEDAALVIEAIASSDYREMAPFFYEDKIKLRYSESAQGAQIFDIIRNATHVGFGRIASATMGVMETCFRSCFYRAGGTLYDNKYGAEIGSYESQYKTNLKLILTTFQKYKDN